MSPSFNGCLFINGKSCFSQEHLGLIGPEEFVQAFVQKDPLDTTQVKPSLAATTHLQTISMNLVHPNVCLINDLRELWSEGKHLQKEEVSSIKNNIYIYFLQESTCKKYVPLMGLFSPYQMKI